MDAHLNFLSQFLFTNTSMAMLELIKSTIIIIIIVIVISSIIILKWAMFPILFYFSYSSREYP